MSDNQIILNYKGPIDSRTTEILLEQVKNDLASQDIKKVLKKRVYNIMVECIENMLRHKAEANEDSFLPYIRLENQSPDFRVTSGNLILNTDLEILSDRLKTLTDSDPVQLQKMYEVQINKESDLTKNGAGLGFLTIALKANNPLQYEFTAFNDQLSIFELRVIISPDKN